MISVLTLTGPCAVGLSVNTALFRKNVLKGFNVGWLQYDKEEIHASIASTGSDATLHGEEYVDSIGDVLILLVSCCYVSWHHIVGESVDLPCTYTAATYI